MKNNKCPGLDGLNKEFYVQFFDELAVTLLDVYNFAYLKGKLNPSARVGLISLIPKKSSNLQELGSWRPLSLLNLDNKILSKTIAERLKPVLQYLIADHQTGFMKNQNIAENIRCTYEIIRYCRKTNKPGLIVSIYFSKCFDKIEHSAIRKAFEYYNFGDTFINWVMLFFSNLQIYTQNFGFLSPSPFIKERGSNQGCCISPACFLLCGELMSRRLLENKKIKGIDMKNGEIKNLLSQFADDTALYLSYDRISLNETIDTLALIEANIGLSINYDKTLIYRIGSLENSNAKLITKKNLCWSDSSFKLLGVNIGNKEEDTDNFSDIVNKMRCTLDTWYHRQFTLMGKVLIVNTLCESLFVYRLSVTLDINTVLIKRIDQLINNFIWKGRRARIAKETLESSKKCGGLRLFSVTKKQAALKINWIRKIENNEFFKYCFFNGTNLPNVDFIFECNLNVRDCKKYVQSENF